MDKHDDLLEKLKADIEPSRERIEARDVATRKRNQKTESKRAAAKARGERADDLAHKLIADAEAWMHTLEQEVVPGASVTVSSDMVECCLEIPYATSSRSCKTVFQGGDYNASSDKLRLVVTLWDEPFKKRKCVVTDADVDDLKDWVRKTIAAAVKAYFETRADSDE